MNTLPLALSVPEAGRRLYGIGRDAAYAAAERGEIPCQKVGRRLVVPTHAALQQLGMSDELIARTLGLPERSEAGPASPAIAFTSIRALAKEQESLDDAPDPAA